MGKLLRYIAAYALWLVMLLLAGALIILIRQAVPLVGARLIGTGNPNEYMLGQQVRFAVEALTYVLGTVWLIAAIVMEDRCRVGARKGRLGRYVQRTLGPELLLLFTAGLTIRLCTGASPADRLILPALIVVLAAGLTLTIYGYTSLRLPGKQPSQAAHNLSR